LSQQVAPERAASESKIGLILHGEYLGMTEREGTVKDPNSPRVGQSFTATEIHVLAGMSAVTVSFRDMGALVRWGQSAKIDINKGDRQKIEVPVYVSAQGSRTYYNYNPPS